MTDIDIPSMTRHVAGLFFVIGLLFGAIANKTHFCTMGAVADIVNMGDWNRMRMWWLAMGSAMVGTGVLQFVGIIDVTQALQAGPRLMVLSVLFGGLIFGIGMVLASGCGGKTLVRIGAGNLKSLVVFMALGISAYMTLRGLFGVWRVATVDTVVVSIEPTQALGPLLFANSPGLALALAVAVGVALMLPAVLRAEARTLDVWLGGLGLGLLVVAGWWASGSYGFVPEHPDTLEPAFLATNSGRMESLSFVAPFAYSLDLLMFWSDTSRIVTAGIAAALGVIVGSALMALATRSFRWEGFADTEDTANHLVGGVLMGAGGVLAMGCTIGQGLSGISVLSISALLAVPAMVAGAWLGLRYQVWRLEKRYG